jgi:3-hydroxyacyl-[acyl-carrier-protein] dehydratase
MNINEVKNFLPHRYPFLLIDRVLDFEVGKRLTAIKNVTFNEPQFTGHFPSQPIMTEMNINDVKNFLPHRYPFLLIDKVLNIEIGKSLTAIKNVSFNEPQFTGHFPSQPIMPGVLIIEALAQATGILAFKSEVGKPQEGQIYMLVGVDNARFKRMVEPGDQLKLEVEVVTVKRGIWKFKGTAYVDNNVVTSAELMCTQKASE